jgi:hypothetical protein
MGQVWWNLSAPDYSRCSDGGHWFVRALLDRSACGVREANAPSKADAGMQVLYERGGLQKHIMW